MKVYLLKYLRPERKFPSPQALGRQIRKDIQRTLRVPLPIGGRGAGKG